MAKTHIKTTWKDRLTNEEVSTRIGQQSMENTLREGRLHLGRSGVYERTGSTITNWITDDEVWRPFVYAKYFRRHQLQRHYRYHFATTLSTLPYASCMVWNSTSGNMTRTFYQATLQRLHANSLSDSCTVTTKLSTPVSFLSHICGMFYCFKHNSGTVTAGLAKAGSQLPRVWVGRVSTVHILQRHNTDIDRRVGAIYCRIGYAPLPSLSTDRSFTCSTTNYRTLNRRCKAFCTQLFYLQSLLSFRCRWQGLGALQESPAVADKPARRLRKVCTVYVRAVGL